MTKSENILCNHRVASAIIRHVYIDTIMYWHLNEILRAATQPS